MPLPVAPRSLPVELVALPASTERHGGTPATWDVCAVVEGAGAWRYRRSIYESRPGSVRLKEPGERFSTPSVASPMQLCIIRVDPALVARQLEPIAARPHLALAQRDDARLFELTCAAFRR